MVRVVSRDMEEGVFRMKMDPIRSSHASIKPFFDGISTMYKVAPSEGVTSKTKVHHAKMVYEALKPELVEKSTGLPPIFSS